MELNKIKPRPLINAKYSVDICEHLCNLYLTHLCLTLWQRNHRNYLGQDFWHYSFGLQTYLKKMQTMASLPEKITSTINSLCSFRELKSFSEASRETLAENLGSKSINEKKHFSNDFDTDKREYLRTGPLISQKAHGNHCVSYFFFSVTCRSQQKPLIIYASV